MKIVKIFECSNVFVCSNSTTNAEEYKEKRLLNLKLSENGIYGNMITIIAKECVSEGQNLIKKRQRNDKEKVLSPVH